MSLGEVNFCIRCGTRLELKYRSGRNRPICPKCDWTYFPDPKVAAAVLVVADQKVLLTRRANSPKRGLWTLPVGFVDAGEDPARAAERECLEETGLEVRVTELLDVIFGQEHPNGSHILIIYRAEIFSGDLNPGDDVDQAAFFLKNQLPPLAFSSSQTIITQFV